MPKKKTKEQERIEELERENYLLTLENAYLKNLRALVESEERSQGKNTKPSSEPRKSSRKPD